MNQIFIHTNKKQEVGALLSKYSIEKYLSKSIPVNIIYVEDCPEITKYDGEKYIRAGQRKIFNISDLQSFTLIRFIIPEYCNYIGNALIIDPDIFVANCTDVSEIFELSDDYKIMACYNEGKKSYKSSVMVLNNNRLRNWGFKLVDKLFNEEIDYSVLMNLNYEADVYRIHSGWNDFDDINEKTKLVHYTNRITQPWKTGLKIDFDYNLNNNLIGRIKNFIYKNTRRYQAHNNQIAFDYFINLFKSAYIDGYITDDVIRYHIKNNNLRHDIMELI